ncbi:MAG: hypothetical protein R3B93_14750 [Bacteroidia bacterium]
MILAILIDFLGSRGRKQKAKWQNLADAELIDLYQKTGQLEIISHIMHRYQGLIVARTLNYLKGRRTNPRFYLAFVSTPFSKAQNRRSLKLSGLVAPDYSQCAY